MKQPPQTGRPRLPLIATINFFSFLDTNLLIPIMALYASSLGAGPGIVGFLVGLYSIANAPANIVSGRFIDRLGHKIPMVTGMLGSALSMFLYSLTSLPFQLGLVRVIHGICGGIKSPAVMSAFTEGTDESGRGRVMALYGMSLAIANLVGFGLSGVIASNFGYTPLFFSGMAVLVAGALIGMTLPKPVRHVQVHPSLKEDMIKIKLLLKKRGLQVSFMAIFAQYFAFGGVVTLLPLRVRDLGMDAFHVGMVLAAFTVMFIVLQFPSGMLSDRLGRRKLINAGLLLAIVSLVLLPQMTSFVTLLAVMAVYGVAFGLIFPSASALVADNSGAQERGTASGIFHALLTAGVGVGAPVMGGISGLVGIKTGLDFNPTILIIVLGLFLTVMRK